MSERRKLTPKRQRFVEAYTGEAMGNATEAARIAGYAKPHPEGSRLLRIATVAEAVAKASRATQSAAIATREERQAMLTRIMRGDEPEVRYDAVGEPIEAQAAMRDRIKALELLGKMQGDFIERQQVEHSGGAVVVKLSYEDTRRLAAEGDD